ncbi:MAG: cyanophycin synthetase, partial [Pseudomonadota bacterium]
FDALRAAFKTFVENIPFYGAAVCCIDHPEVQVLIGRIRDRRVVTYGFSPQADIRASEPRYDESGAAVFDVDIRSRRTGEARRIEAVRLPMPGAHNVLNALAAIAVARELKIDDGAMRAALDGFTGVKRRFTQVGLWNGVRIIDDYGHHPVEIRAVLKAARASSQGRIIVVHQPHRYTRLRDLFPDFCGCFNDADVVAIMDVFAAGEAAIDGIGRDALVDGLRAHGHRQAVGLAGPEALPALVRAEAQPGDLVVCLGAGDITRAANGLEAALEKGR